MINKFSVISGPKRFVIVVRDYSCRVIALAGDYLGHPSCISVVDKGLLPVTTASAYNFIGPGHSTMEVLADFRFGIRTPVAMLSLSVLIVGCSTLEVVLGLQLWCQDLGVVVHCSVLECRI